MGPRPPWRGQRPSLPPALDPLLEGLEEKDAFTLDERFRHALAMSSVKMPASGLSSRGCGAASCTVLWATQVVRPTHAITWEWTPRARGRSCVSSARPS
jgi:hypothetical protein